MSPRPEFSFDGAVIRPASDKLHRRLRVMGTDAQLIVVTYDVQAGEEALLRAEDDLRETERVLSRFQEDSDLSRLNREGSIVADDRLYAALLAASNAYELSEGLLDPRVIGSLEALGYKDRLPSEEVVFTREREPLGPMDMKAWSPDDSRRVTLPAGVRLDLAGVGKALGIGWAAMHLAGHAGLLVDVGGDIVALGTDTEGDPWKVAINHDSMVGQFEGAPLAVATSTTTRRAWKAGGRTVHHLIDPRTGEPSDGEIVYATVSAPNILEADLAAKLLILEGREAVKHFDGSLQAVVTDSKRDTAYLSGEEGSR